jgi:hypothetical protein
LKQSVEYWAYKYKNHPNLCEDYQSENQSGYGNSFAQNRGYGKEFLKAI